MLATREESSPPDRSTPSGASDMSRFTTAAMSVSCESKRHFYNCSCVLQRSTTIAVRHKDKAGRTLTSCKSNGWLGITDSSTQLGLNHRSSLPVLLR